MDHRTAATKYECFVVVDHKLRILIAVYYIDPLRQEAMCNSGPAILYTAIVVTLLHAGVMLGGYLYYRHYGYTPMISSKKLFSSHNYSNENIAATVRYIT